MSIYTLIDGTSPFGLRRNSTVFVVAPSRNEAALPRAALLESGTVALATPLSLSLLQATRRGRRVEGKQQRTERPPTDNGLRPHGQRFTSRTLDRYGLHRGQVDPGPVGLADQVALRLLFVGPEANVSTGWSSA